MPVIPTSNSGQRLQPLGGFLADGLRKTLAATGGTSMRALLEAVPSTVVPSRLAAWEDIDTKQALKAWQA